MRKQSMRMSVRKIGKGSMDEDGVREYEKEREEHADKKMRKRNIGMREGNS